MKSDSVKLGQVESVKIIQNRLSPERQAGQIKSAQLKSGQIKLYQVK